MTKILIYGDSNTWGDNFLTNKRIDDEKQWPIILQKKLGSGYKILQEGLPGRIAGDEEQEKKYKNGKDSFISTFRTNAPIDTLIISLGTNDLQLKYNKSDKKIIEDLLWYKNTLLKSFEDIEDREKYFKNKMPNIIYILPINFDYKENAKVVFDELSEEKRKNIHKYFLNSGEKVISLNDMSLFDDGIHLNYDGHKKMSDVVLEVLINE